ncbi:MAG: flagellar hook assembly protein FlgD [Hyphomicrobiaceae bacterium]
MQVDATSSVASTQGATSTSQTQKTTLDYDSFLQLLIAELENQDPTEPMKSSEYVAQLATFSNVEQQIQTNTKLDALLASTALLQFDGVIGRTVTSADGAQSGQVSSVRITDSGAVAILTTGAEVPLGPGITVS